MPAEIKLDFNDWFGFLTQSFEELYAISQAKNIQGSGPGGQHRNRVKTGVELLHPESGIVVRATAHREAKRNQQDALRQLRLEFALAMAAPVTDQRLHEAAWIFEQWQNNSPPLSAFRAKINPEHKDYAFFAGLALLAMEMHRGNLKAVAQTMKTTSSALVRFYKLNKHVWQIVATIRKRHSQSALR